MEGEPNGSLRLEADDARRPPREGSDAWPQAIPF
jgi:hypothetical protein